MMPIWNEVQATRKKKQNITIVVVSSVLGLCPWGFQIWRKPRPLFPLAGKGRRSLLGCLRRATGDALGAPRTLKVPRI